MPEEFNVKGNMGELATEIKLAHPGRCHSVGWVLS